MTGNPISIFFSYSRNDEGLMKELEGHLEPLKLSGMLSSWHDGCIAPGEEWGPQIKANLEKAQVILLLISVDFIQPNHRYDIELTKAIERHKAGDACVIPVILRHCMWEQIPVGDMQLGELQALPKDAQPISKWSDRDEAFTSIAKGLFEKIQHLHKEQEWQNQTTLSLPNTTVEVLEQQAVAKIQTSSHPDTPILLPPKRADPTLPPTSQPAVPEEDLTSQKWRISYHKLRELLHQRKWKAADQETAERMLEVMGRQSEGWLRGEDIEQFPCKDLKIIDHLWVNASNGKFGFSVQKQIWRECGSPNNYNADWERFGDRLGWRSHGEWIYYNNVTFDTSAHEGHLPISGVVRARLGCAGARGWRWVLFAHIQTCKVDPRF